MWFNIKAALYYIITSPVVVAKNFYSFLKRDNDTTENKYSWKSFFTMSRDSKLYMKSLEDITHAKLMLRSIFPYDKNNNSREYNSLTYHHYTLYLALLKYHAKVIQQLPNEFNRERTELSRKLVKRITEIQDKDIPLLNDKRSHILDPVISESRQPNVEQILIKAKHDAELEAQAKEESFQRERDTFLREQDRLYDTINNKQQDIDDYKQILESERDKTTDLEKKVTSMKIAVKINQEKTEKFKELLDQMDVTVSRLQSDNDDKNLEISRLKEQLNIEILQK